MKQACQLELTTVRNDETTHEVAYTITSVSRTQADAARLLEWWRGHWSIENKEHCVRYETFGEDRSQIRSGATPQILAA